MTQILSAQIRVLEIGAPQNDFAQVGVANVSAEKIAVGKVDLVATFDRFMKAVDIAGAKAAKGHVIEKTGPFRDAGFLVGHCFFARVGAAAAASGHDVVDLEHGAWSAPENRKSPGALIRLRKYTAQYGTRQQNKEGLSQKMNPG
ncbi:MAG: hypothetical protein QGG71_06055 [Pirellulaceae bacterium]|nr:hypothetical protein [Pirellulaceae bacterium]